MAEGCIYYSRASISQSIHFPYTLYKTLPLRLHISGNLVPFHTSYSPAWKIQFLHKTCTRVHLHHRTRRIAPRKYSCLPNRIHLPSRGSSTSILNTHVYWYRLALDSSLRVQRRSQRHSRREVADGARLKISHFRDSTFSAVIKRLHLRALKFERRTKGGIKWLNDIVRQPFFSYTVHFSISDDPILSAATIISDDILDSTIYREIGRWESSFARTLHTHYTRSGL